MIHLCTNEAKLNSYTEKVLKPLVAGLKNKKALASKGVNFSFENKFLMNFSSLKIDKKI